MTLKKYFLIFFISQILITSSFAQYYNPNAATSNSNTNNNNNSNNPNPVTPNNPGTSSSISNQINSDTQIRDLFNQADYQHLVNPESDAQQLQISEQP